MIHTNSVDRLWLEAMLDSIDNDDGRATVPFAHEVADMHFRPIASAPVRVDMRCDEAMSLSDGELDYSSRIRELDARDYAKRHAARRAGWARRWAKRRERARRPAVVIDIS